jgi:outer membrane lipoprotein-sorting protein
MKEIIKLALFLLLPCILPAQVKINTTEILHQAELKRMPWAQMSFYATLTDSSASGKSITAYHVFFKDDKALVACMDPLVQKGNLLLLQNREMWFYFKSTAQPVKITALQRLSGSVSFVDMAKLNWTSDYSVDSIKSIITSEEKKEAFLLFLHAASEKVSYRKMNLWVRKKDSRPIKADIYLTSGKLYKTLLFTKYEIIDGKEINTQVEFTDYFNNGRKTVIDFSKAKKEKNLPDSYFLKENLPALSKQIETLRY